jgi:hypothetical protein
VSGYNYLIIKNQLRESWVQFFDFLCLISTFESSGVNGRTRRNRLLKFLGLVLVVNYKSEEVSAGSQLELCLVSIFLDDDFWGYWSYSWPWEGASSRL